MFTEFELGVYGNESKTLFGVRKLTASCTKRRPICVTPEAPLRKLATPLPEPVPNSPRIDADSAVRQAARLVSEAGSAGVILTGTNTDVGVVSVASLLLNLSLD